MSDMERFTRASAAVAAGMLLPSFPYLLVPVLCLLAADYLRSRQRRTAT